MKKVVKLTPPVGQRYFAAGKTVRRRPLETHYDDGSSGVTMGFAIAEVDSHVVDPQTAAERIASLLNADEVRLEAESAEIPA